MTDPETKTPEMETQADPWWEQPCLAYNLQARLPRASVGWLMRMQECLTREVSAPVNVVPALALHVSLYSPVPFSWPADAKEAFWLSKRPHILNLMPEIANCCSALELHFEATRVFPSAVVAIARDETESVRRIRQRIADVCRHPTLPAPTYDIIHCTLARFAAKATISSDELQAYESNWRPFSTRIQTLVLVRERRYPSLDVDEIIAVRL
jgi:hypothetical protein